MVTEAPIRLDIGAGTQANEEGWTSLDIVDVFRPDIQGDLLHLPVQSDSVDEIRCTHVLEHLPIVYFAVDWARQTVMTRNSFLDAMNEMWRILKVGGTARVEVPVFPYPSALADPTHLNFIVAERFLYLDPEQTLMPLIGVNASTKPYLQMYGIKPWKLLSKTRMATGSVIVIVMEKREDRL